MRFLSYGQLDPGELSDKVDKVRAAIEADDFKSPDVKKLNLGQYYRARLDAASRLLLMFVEWRGERAALALEVIRNHEYAKSRFLRGAPVDEAKLVEPVVPALVEPAPIRYLHSTRTTFHVLDKPLSFDDSQEEILARRPPLLLVGSAGSGKTALMLEKLRAQPGRVAYVTDSEWLSSHARDLYVAHGWDPGEQEADFLSYRQLIESIEVPKGRPVLFSDFRAFFERYRGRRSLNDAHQCFEELRGVLTAEPSGPLTLDAYLALGVRQSIFSAEQRSALHGLLPAFRSWLSSSNLYEPNLVAHALLARMEQRYDFIAVDEVQDLTTAQLALVLGSLKAAGQFVVAGDANQIVHPNFFSWAKVKTLFWRGIGLDEARDVAVLDVSYRNSEAVTAAANAVLRLRHSRFGSVDRESNALMRAVAGIAGEVRGLQTGSPAVAELDERTRRSTRTAVIVLREEHKAEARQRFGTPLVFSVLEAKGLEYENIILFRMVSTERRVFAELCEGVTDEDLARESLEYRRAKDKSDKSLEVYKFFVNALYVGLTRAIVNAWIVDDEPDHPLWKKLSVEFGGASTPVRVAEASVEEWQREAARLEQHGKQEQAEAIRTTVLKLAKVPWPVLDEAALRPLAGKALDPAGISNKARQQLYEYACFHGDAVIADRLARIGFGPAASFEETGGQIARRLRQPYEARNFKDLLWQTERFGVDFRNPMNLTPLMAAAGAGNARLVEALLARGARGDLRDHLGHLPVHWAIIRAYQAPDFARGDFGAVYDLLAPASFDAQVLGRMVQVGREQGEYFIFQVMLALWCRGYEPWGRASGFSSSLMSEAPFPDFPEVAVREARRKRSYINHVLARSEAGSSYPSSRRLWCRERQGQYSPNADLSLRVALPDGTDAWQPIHQVINVAWLESQLKPSR